MRIVLSNIGTYGDIHPLIAIALELKRRGHVPVMALPALYAPKIKPLGIEFRPIRPDIDPTDKGLIAMIYDVKGTETGLREFLFPHLRETYADLLDAATRPERADLLLLGELNYAGPLVAEVTGIPWASYVLAPLSFFSAFDPPVLPPYPRLARADRTPGMGRVMKRLARLTTRRWPEPIYELRRELGLERGANPLFDAKHSPYLVLALFSRVLGTEQKDWPPNALITGFCFYDAEKGNAELPPHLEKFLGAGPAPVVFTLGSAAVMAAGKFYEHSARAAITLGVRAVLLIGADDERNRPRQALPDSICVAEYAPYSKLFPRASVVVHQGGVGTTAQCLAAGRPMLIMPYSHDQPDNARRMRRLKVARVIQRGHYTPLRVARKLKGMMEKDEYARNAEGVARILAREDGTRTACDALEELWRKSASSS